MTCQSVVVRHRKLIWFSAIASWVAVCIALWGQAASKSHPMRPLAHFAVSVAFQGYSNSVSGQKWALLAITNRDRGDLCFFPPNLVQLGVGVLSGPESLGVLSNWHETQWQYPPAIPRGSFCRIAVEVPPGHGSWRARCLLMRFTWSDKLLSRVPRWWPGGLIPLRGDPSLGALLTDWTPQRDSPTNGLSQ
jgi:hypothetical protein